MSEDATLDKFLKTESEGQNSSEWSESKLEDLLSELLTGSRPTGGGLDEGEYISIGGTQINSQGYIDLQDLVYISEDYFEQVEETQLQKHDILVVKDGANTGDVAIAWRSDNRIVTNEHLFTLRTDSNINSPYLFYFLLSHQGWKQINGTITGSAQEGINRGFAGKVDIQYPSLSEQRKIATVLYTVDRVIEKTEEVIETYETVREGLLREVIRRGVTGDGERRPVPDKSPELYSKTRWGEIPEQWDVEQVSEIVLSDRPVTYGIVKAGEHIEDGIPMIRGENYINGWEPLSNFFRVSSEVNDEYSRSTVRSGDILIAVAGANAGAVNIVPQWMPDEVNISRSTARISVDDSDVIPEYMRFVLESPFLQKQIHAWKKGSAQDVLNLTDVKKFEVPLPTIEEQERIVSVLSNIREGAIKERELKNQYLRIKRGLMQDLLSGTISTTDTNIEVPEEIA